MPLSCCEDRLVVGAFYDEFLSSYIGKEEPILDTLYDEFLTKVKKDTKVEEDKVMVEVSAGITSDFSLITGLPLPVNCLSCGKSFIPVNISYCPTTSRITYSHNPSKFCSEECSKAYALLTDIEEYTKKTLSSTSSSYYTTCSWNYPSKDYDENEDYDENQEEEIPGSPVNYKDKLLVQYVEGRKIKRVSG